MSSAGDTGKRKAERGRIRQTDRSAQLPIAVADDVCATFATTRRVCRRSDRCKDAAGSLQVLKATAAPEKMPDLVRLPISTKINFHL